MPAAGAEGAALSKMITRLHSDTLYRVSVMAVTGAGSGVALFVDGRTRPAARQLHLSLYILYIFSIRFVHGSVFMFPMAGHSVLRIWTGLGVLPPYNPRMVTRELFLQRNRATPEHRGQCSNASRRGSSSSSYQPRPACGRRCCGWACVQRQQLWCLRRHDTSLCWGACPIDVPRHSDRSTGGWPTQHGVGVLLLQISWCRPSKQHILTQQYFFVCESVGGTINALTFSTTCCSHGCLLEVLAEV